MRLWAPAPRHARPAAAVLLAFLAVSALSGGTSATGFGSGGSAVLTVTGQIPVACGILINNQENAQVTGLDFSQPASVQATLAIGCNVPLLGSYQAANGAFVHTDTPSLQLPYKASVSFGGLGAQGPFPGSDLTTPKTFGGGSYIAFEESGSLTVEWEQAAPAAGTYRETLTFTVTPQL
jgi:hypothetical protein